MHQNFLGQQYDCLRVKVILKKEVQLKISLLNNTATKSLSNKEFYFLIRLISTNSFCEPIRILGPHVETPELT